MAAQSSIPDALHPFWPDPEKVPQFIEALTSPEMSLQRLAADWNMTVGALCLFMESDAGLELLGGIEFVLATRLRVIALSALPAVAATLNSIVKACPGDEAAASLSADITNQKLLEFKRTNARRAAALLIRLGTHRPRTSRPSAMRSDAPSQREGDGGRVRASQASCASRDDWQQTTPPQPLPSGEGREQYSAPMSSPVPPVGGSATTGVLNPPESPAPSSTPTTNEGSSAVVVHVGAANTPLLLPPLPITSPLGQVETKLVASMPRRIPSRASSLANRAGSAVPSGP